jgi:uridine kinase
VTAQNDSVLLFDGVFLLRPELNDHWDLRVFVRVDFAEAVCRGVLQGQGVLGSAEAALARYNSRYLAGQRIYLETVRPERLADLVVNNDDPSNHTLDVSAAGAS